MKTMTVTVKESTCWILFTLGLLITLLATSCESKSGNINPIPQEKVVIIDSAPFGSVENGYNYKVKRINHGVVTYVKSMYKFESGDTILWRFPSERTD